MITVGIDRWTRDPHELKFRERARKHVAKRKEPLTDRVTSYVKNRWEGTHHKCAAGCGGTGEFWRGGRGHYCAKCVGKGSGWESSKLPVDRTPPITRSRRRELARTTRDLRKDED